MPMTRSAELVVNSNNRYTTYATGRRGAQGRSPSYRAFSSVISNITDTGDLLTSGTFSGTRRAEGSMAAMTRVILVVTSSVSLPNKEEDSTALDAGWLRGKGTFALHDENIAAGEPVRPLTTPSW